MDARPESGLGTPGRAKINFEIFQAYLVYFSFFSNQLRAMDTEDNPYRHSLV